MAVVNYPNLMNTPISGHTRLLGVVADPVKQARTPGMANALLDKRGLFGTFVLVPMHVSSDGFESFIAGIRCIKNFSGAVLSMPHKVVAAHLVDELTDEARLAGAVNVIRRLDDGRLVGTILDGEGFVAGLQSEGHSVRGASVLMAGAGGAASALAFALAKHGVSALYIQNRSPQRASDLARRVASAYPSVKVSTSCDESARFDLAVNATSLGMAQGDELPISLALIERSVLVAECVIAPEMTELLKAASAMGKRIHTGVPMLSAQMNLMLDFMGAKEAP